jgi:hypothetical protein
LQFPENFDQPHTGQAALPVEHLWAESSAVVWCVSMQFSVEGAA